MHQKQTRIGKNRNKLSTNTQVTDMALTLWECNEYIIKTMLRTNLNSYFRDRLARIAQRLSKEAVQLGGDLDQPNEKAFETIHSTKTVARQLGLLD